MKIKNTNFKMDFIKKKDSKLGKYKEIKLISLLFMEIQQIIKQKSPSIT